MNFISRITALITLSITKYLTFTLNGIYEFIPRLYNITITLKIHDIMRPGFVMFINIIL